MLCPNCETENRAGARFCDQCGFPLTGAIAARAVEAAADPVDNATEEAKSAMVEEAGVTEAIEPLSPAPAKQAPELTGEETPMENAAGMETDADEAAGLPRDRAAFETEGEESADPQIAESTEPAGLSGPNFPDFPKGQEAPKGQEDQEGYETHGTPEPGAEYVPTPEEEALYGEAANAPDLTGVISPDFDQPAPNWRDGSTMQMPRVEGEEPARSKDYLSSSTTAQKRGKKTAVIAVVVVILVAAAIAFATYQMELWGGKAVPDVRGMTEADATSVLEDSGFATRSTQVKSADTEGLVLITDPAAGSRVNKGDEVVVHVATARAIPSVVGKTETEAKAAFDKEGYENVSYVKEHSDSAEGTVLSVAPDVGTRAKSTVAVTVKVAEPYVVPDTASSMSLDDTIAAIQEAGLQCVVNEVDTTDYPEGTVMGTDPAAGTKVKSDTVVSINVARARGAQLTQLTKELLSPGSEIEVGGTSFIIKSLDSVNYLGNDQVAFTATARPYTVFFGVYVEGDPQQVNGVVTWTADNRVSSIS